MDDGVSELDTDSHVFVMRLLTADVSVPVQQADK